MNRGYKFGHRSEVFISTLCAPLQEICRGGLVIANSRKLYCPDFAIIRGYETAEGQFELFKKGRAERYVVGSDEPTWRKVGATVTNCDGYNNISDHQKADIHGGAFAFDFCAYVGGTNYDDSNMSLIATCFFEAASNLGLVIDWGGNYRSISDGSHISLIV